MSVSCWFVHFTIHTNGYGAHTYTVQYIHIKVYFYGDFLELNDIYHNDLLV